MPYDTVDSSGDYYGSDEQFDYTENIDVADDDSNDSEDISPYDIEEYSGDDTGFDTEEDSDVEVDESDVEEVDPYDPSYFDEPDTFASDEERLEWYQDRLDTVKQVIDSNSDIYRSFAKQTEQALVQRMESEFEGFGIMHEALQTDPRGFLLQFIPEALAEHGINPIMNETELLERVETDLQKEYGDDYRMRLNQTEIFNPRSFTAQVWAKQQSLIREWDTINARNREIITKWNDTLISPASQPSQQAGYNQQDLDSLYAEHFKDRYDRSEFNELMTEAQQRKFTPQDMERVIRFDEFIDAAYNKGLREASAKGKQSFDRASREGNVVRARDSQMASQPATSNSTSYDFNSFFNGGIPHY